MRVHRVPRRVRFQVERREDPMATEIRKSGIDVVGDMVAWGAHFCLFYETKEDLLDTLTSYCRSGLDRGEYCLWIVADPLTIEEARGALKDAVPEVIDTSRIPAWRWRRPATGFSRVGRSTAR